MTTLSTAAWAAHEVGLATAIGGTLYGRAAFEPALHEIDDPETRDQISAQTWKRFSWMNLAAHGVVGATWAIGRFLLSGREVSGTARTLTMVKDGLMAASLVTGIGSVVIGRMLAKRVDEGHSPARARVTPENDRRTVALQRTVGVVGNINLVANVSILAITTVLAMEGNKSSRFSWFSRWLP